MEAALHKCIKFSQIRNSVGAAVMVNVTQRLFMNHKNNYDGVPVREGLILERKASILKKLNAYYYVKLFAKVMIFKAVKLVKNDF